MITLASIQSLQHSPGYKLKRRNITKPKLNITQQFTTRLSNWLQQKPQHNSSGRVLRLTPPDEHTAPSHLSLAAAYTITKRQPYVDNSGNFGISPTTTPFVGDDTQRTRLPPTTQLQRLLESPSKRGIKSPNHTTPGPYVSKRKPGELSRIFSFLHYEMPTWPIYGEHSTAI
jgi:hypothetical protein